MAGRRPGRGRGQMAAREWRGAGPGRHAGRGPAKRPPPLAKTPVTSAGNIRKSSGMAYLKRHYGALPPKATLACYFCRKGVREEGPMSAGSGGTAGAPGRGDPS